MIVTTPALAAHFRLLNSLPVRVHRRPEVDFDAQRNPEPSVTAHRRERIRVWMKLKKPPSLGEMSKALGITRRSVQLHKQRIREGR